jgi:15-cis-phytoene desaturase
VNKKVIILGGGVAGMSAAHELMERGFQVTVYEKRSIPGGKARSVPVPFSGKDDKPDLPGEHGFRCFACFYKHVTDTMKRIPYKNNPMGVFDNLINTTRVDITQFGKSGVTMLARFPQSFKDLKIMLESIKGFNERIGLDADEVNYFAKKIWQYLTTCHARRREDFEKITWWEFIRADFHSAAYQKLLAQGLTRSLVAANAKIANCKVEGDIVVQLLLGLLRRGGSVERILNGPTNDVWIDPWLEYLRKKNVTYEMQTIIDTIHCNGRTITGVTLRNKDGITFEDKADYYILAVPVEVAAELFSQSRHAPILTADPNLIRVIKLAQNVVEMRGIQFYLKEDIPIVHGPVLYVDTPWALTSISHRQFWENFDLKEYGDGAVGGILSVIVSDIGEPGILYNKAAKDCTREEIVKEVWEQLKISLNLPGEKTLLEDSNLHSWFFNTNTQEKYEYAEPLYIDIINSWHLRPDAHTGIPNFFLAADYVRTNTQLATMEAANEAARRAVNSIISVSGVKAFPCKIWSFKEPFIFSFGRWYDNVRYKRGEPWQNKFPWWLRVVRFIIAILYRFWEYSNRSRKLDGFLFRFF